MSLQGVECKNKSEPPGAGAGAVAKDARCEWPPRFSSGASDLPELSSFPSPNPLHPYQGPWEPVTSDLSVNPGGHH